MSTELTESTDNKQKAVSIGFFTTARKGFLISHNKGLNEEQIAELHSLKVGDRLKVWVNTEEKGRARLSLQKLVEYGVAEEDGLSA